MNRFEPLVAWKHTHNSNIAGLFGRYHYSLPRRCSSLGFNHWMGLCNCQLFSAPVNGTTINSCCELFDSRSFIPTNLTIINQQHLKYYLAAFILCSQHFTQLWLAICPQSGAAFAQYSRQAAQFGPDFTGAVARWQHGWRQKLSGYHHHYAYQYIIAILCMHAVISKSRGNYVSATLPVKSGQVGWNIMHV